MSRSSFSRFISSIRANGMLAVQPRMGWGDPLLMRRALQAVKAESSACVGTLTIDSYTRTGDYRTPLECLRNGEHLNGYPLLSHSAQTTRSVLEGLLDDKFPVQVRHGTPEPQALIRRTVEVGLDATEGGPVSYCFPYGRTPLATSIRAWREACGILAGEADNGHLESFGGCLMGQLCPPAMLLAVTILEGLFFKQYAIRSLSLSYAQGTSYTQDRAALTLLRDLAARYFADVDWHIVVYTYMGLFPESEAGASRLIQDSARLAVECGCERLIVKTRTERRQIPALVDNLTGIRLALASAAQATCSVLSRSERDCYDELAVDVRAMLEAVLNLHSDLSQALPIAFRRGLLDIPYCLHPDNRRAARAAIDEHGHVRWTHAGNLPVKDTRADLDTRLSSQALLAQLSYVARSYDDPCSSGGSLFDYWRHSALAFQPR